jgi:hypothetical protein
VKRYRCRCQTFSPLKNRYRYIIKKQIIGETKKIFNVKKNVIIEYLFFEPGGIYDEYALMCQIKKMLKRGPFSGEIKISILESLYAESDHKKLIDRSLDTLSRGVSALSVGIVTDEILPLKKYLLGGVRDYLFLIAFDEYYFFYDDVIKSDNFLKKIAKNKTIIFSSRLHFSKETQQTIEWGWYNPFFEPLIYIKKIIYGKYLQESRLTCMFV